MFDVAGFGIRDKSGGVFTEEEIWVIFALGQGSTEAKLEEITGHVSSLHEHRTRSSFTYTRCCVIDHGHP